MVYKISSHTRHRYNIKLNVISKQKEIIISNVVASNKIDLDKLAIAFLLGI